MNKDEHGMYVHNGVGPTPVAPAPIKPKELTLGPKAASFLRQAMLDRGNRICVSFPHLNDWLDRLEKLTLEESGISFERYT